VFILTGIKMIVFTAAGTTAATNDMRFGSKCWLNGAAIRIGKYGIGTKMIVPPEKLVSYRVRLF
jgi:hypothetical protein